MKANAIFQEHLKLLLDSTPLDYFKIINLIEEELRREYENGWYDGKNYDKR